MGVSSIRELAGLRLGRSFPCSPAENRLRQRLLGANVLRVPSVPPGVLLRHARAHAAQLDKASSAACASWCVVAGRLGASAAGERMMGLAGPAAEPPVESCRV